MRSRFAPRSTTLPRPYFRFFPIRKRHAMDDSRLEQFSKKYPHPQKLQEVTSKNLEEFEKGLAASKANPVGTYPERLKEHKLEEDLQKYAEGKYYRDATRIHKIDEDKYNQLNKLAEQLPKHADRVGPAPVAPKPEDYQAPLPAKPTFAFQPESTNNWVPTGNGTFTRSPQIMDNESLYAPRRHEDIAIQPLAGPRTVASSWNNHPELENLQREYDKFRMFEMVSAGVHPVEAYLRTRTGNEALRSKKISQSTLLDATAIFNQYEPRRKAIDRVVYNLGQLTQPDDRQGTQQQPVNWFAYESRNERIKKAEAITPRVNATYRQVAERNGVDPQTLVTGLGQRSDEQHLAATSKAHTVSITGIAGTGKSDTLKNAIVVAAARGVPVSRMMYVSNTRSGASNLQKLARTLGPYLPEDEAERIGRIEAATPFTLALRDLHTPSIPREDGGLDTPLEKMERDNYQLMGGGRINAQANLSTVEQNIKNGQRAYVSGVLKQNGFNGLTANQMVNFINQKKENMPLNPEAYQAFLDDARRKYEAGDRSSEAAAFHAYEGHRELKPGFEPINDQKSPVFDLQDALHMAAHAGRKGYIPAKPGVILDEGQDSKATTYDYLSSVMAKQAKVIVAGDPSQTTIGAPTNHEELARKFFTNERREGTSFEAFNLTGNYRMGGWGAALANAHQANPALAGLPQAPYTVAMKHTDQPPVFMYRATNKDLYRAGIEHWFDRIGVTPEMMANNLNARNTNPNAHVLDGWKVDPAQAPVVSRMKEQRTDYLNELEQYLVEKLGPEQGKEAFRQIYTTETPGEQPRSLMHVLLTNQARSRSFDYPYVNVTDDGAWDAAGAINQDYTNDTRARKQVVRMGSSELVGSKRRDLRPDIWQGVSYPHGSVGLIRQMVENYIDMQGGSFLNVPPEWRGMLSNSSIYAKPDEVMQEDPQAIADMVSVLQDIANNRLYEPPATDVAGVLSHPESIVGGKGGLEGTDRMEETDNAVSRLVGFRKVTASATTVSGMRDRSILDPQHIDFVRSFFHQMFQEGPETMGRFGLTEAPKAIQMMDPSHPAFGRILRDISQSDGFKDLPKNQQAIILAATKASKEAIDAHKEELSYITQGPEKDWGNPDSYTMEERAAYRADTPDIDEIRKHINALATAPEFQQDPTGRAILMQNMVHPDVIRSLHKWTRNNRNTGSPFDNIPLPEKLQKGGLLRTLPKEELEQLPKEELENLKQVGFTSIRQVLDQAITHHDRGRELRNMLQPQQGEDAPTLTDEQREQYTHQMEESFMLSNHLMRTLVNNSDRGEPDVRTFPPKVWEQMQKENPEEYQRLAPHVVKDFSERRKYWLNMRKHDPERYATFEQHLIERGGARGIDEDIPDVIVRVPNTRKSHGEYFAGAINEFLGSQLVDPKDKEIAYSMAGRQLSRAPLHSDFVAGLQSVAERLYEEHEGVNPEAAKKFDHIATHLDTFVGAPLDETAVRLSSEAFKEIEQKNPRQAQFMLDTIKPPDIDEEGKDTGEWPEGVASEPIEGHMREIMEQMAMPQSKARRKDALGFGYSFLESHIAPMYNQLASYAQRLQSNSRGSGILDPDSGEYLEQYKDIVPNGSMVTLQAFEQRRMEQGARLKYSGKSDQGRVRTYMQDALDAKNIRELLNNDEFKKQAAHYLNVVQQLSMGTHAYDEDEAGQKALSSFFGPQNNPYGPNQRTLSGVRSYVQALYTGMTHMQETGTIQRGHVENLLRSMGHDPESDLFPGLDVLDARGISKPHHEIGLREASFLWPEIMPQLMHDFQPYPYVPNQQVEFVGDPRGKAQQVLSPGDTGKLVPMPDFSYSHPLANALMSGKYDNFLGAVKQQQGVEPMLENFGTARSWEFLNKFHLLGKDTKRSFADRFGNGNENYVPQNLAAGTPYLMEIAPGYQYPVMPDQIKPVKADIPNVFHPQTNEAIADLMASQLKPIGGQEYEPVRAINPHTAMATRRTAGLARTLLVKNLGRIRDFIDTPKMPLAQWLALRQQQKQEELNRRYTVTPVTRRNDEMPTSQTKEAIQQIQAASGGSGRSTREIRAQARLARAQAKSLARQQRLEAAQKQIAAAQQQSGTTRTSRSKRRGTGTGTRASSKKSAAGGDGGEPPASFLPAVQPAANVPVAPSATVEAATPTQPVSDSSVMGSPAWIAAQGQAFLGQGAHLVPPGMRDQAYQAKAQLAAAVYQRQQQQAMSGVAAPPVAEGVGTPAWLSSMGQEVLKQRSHLPSSVNSPLNQLIRDAYQRQQPEPGTLPDRTPVNNLSDDETTVIRGGQPGGAGGNGNNNQPPAPPAGAPEPLPEGQQPSQQQNIDPEQALGGERFDPLQAMLDAPTDAKTVKNTVLRWATEGHPDPDDPKRNIAKPADEQLNAILGDEQSKIIVGGPGGGKTYTLIQSAMREIAKNPDMMPNQVMSLSAVNSAKIALNKNLNKYRNLLPGDEQSLFSIPEPITFHQMAHDTLFGDNRSSDAILRRFGLENYNQNILHNPSEEELEKMDEKERQRAINGSQSTFLRNVLQGHLEDLRKQFPGQINLEAGFKDEQIDEYLREIATYKKQRLSPNDPASSQDAYHLAMELGKRNLSEGKLSNPAALYAYEHALQQNGRLDFDDLVHHGANALEQFGIHALPEQYHDTRLLMVDEAQDLTNDNARMIQSLLASLAPNNPRFLAALDTSQNIFGEGMGGIGNNRIIPTLGKVAEQGLGKQPGVYTLETNHRSDAFYVALNNELLKHESLKGQRVSPIQTPGNRSIGVLPSITMRKSQPELYRTMLSSMLKETGVPLEDIIANIKNGDHPFDGVDFNQPGMTLPKEIPGIVFRNNQVDLLRHEAIKMMRNDWGLSIGQSKQAYGQLFRKGNLDERDATDEEKKQDDYLFHFLKVGQARSLDFLKGHMDVTQVGRWALPGIGNMANYIKSFFVQTSRQAKGGRNFFFGATRPFSNPQMKEYLTKPRAKFVETEKDSPTKGTVYLNDQEVGKRGKKKYEPDFVDGIHVPPMISQFIKGAVNQVKAWQKEGKVDPGNLEWNHYSNVPRKPSEMPAKPQAKQNAQQQSTAASSPSVDQSSSPAQGSPTPAPSNPVQDTSGTSSDLSSSSSSSSASTPSTPTSTPGTSQTTTTTTSSSDTTPPAPTQGQAQVPPMPSIGELLMQHPIPALTDILGADWTNQENIPQKFLPLSMGSVINAQQAAHHGGSYYGPRPQTPPQNILEHMERVYKFGESLPVPQISPEGQAGTEWQNLRGAFNLPQHVAPQHLLDAMGDEGVFSDSFKAQLQDMATHIKPTRRLNQEEMENIRSSVQAKINIPAPSVDTRPASQQIEDQARQQAEERGDTYEPPKPLPSPLQGMPLDEMLQSHVAVDPKDILRADWASEQPADLRTILSANQINAALHKQNKFSPDTLWDQAANLKKKASESKLQVTNKRESDWYFIRKRLGFEQGVTPKAFVEAGKDVLSPQLQKHILDTYHVNKYKEPADLGAFPKLAKLFASSGQGQAPIPFQEGAAGPPSSAATPTPTSTSATASQQGGKKPRPLKTRGKSRATTSTPPPPPPAPAPQQVTPPPAPQQVPAPEEFTPPPALEEEESNQPSTLKALMQANSVMRPIDLVRADWSSGQIHGLDQVIGANQLNRQELQFYAKGQQANPPGSLWDRANTYPVRGDSHTRWEYIRQSLGLEKGVTPVDFVDAGGNQLDERLQQHILEKFYSKEYKKSYAPGFLRRLLPQKNYKSLQKFFAQPEGGPAVPAFDPQQQTPPPAPDDQANVAPPPAPMTNDTESLEAVSVQRHPNANGKRSAVPTISDAKQLLLSGIESSRPLPTQNYWYDQGGWQRPSPAPATPAQPAGTQAQPPAAPAQPAPAPAGTATGQANASNQATQVLNTNTATFHVTGNQVQANFTGPQQGSQKNQSQPTIRLDEFGNPLGPPPPPINPYAKMLSNGQPNPNIGWSGGKPPTNVDTTQQHWSDENNEDATKTFFDPNKANFNNGFSNAGRTMARIGNEMQFVAKLFDQITTAALQQGAEYRRATLVMAGSGADGTQGFYDFTNKKSGISQLSQQMPMFSMTQLAQALQQQASLSGVPAPSPGNVAATKDILGLSALTGIDSSQLTAQMSSIAGMTGDASNTQIQQQLAGAMYQMYNGNLSALNVTPTLQAVQETLPNVQGMALGGGSQLNQVLGIMQGAQYGGMGAQNMPQVASMINSLTNLGSTPDLQGQYFLQQLYAGSGQQMTANPQLMQYQSQRSDEMQQLNQLQLRQSYDAEGMQISVNNAQISMEKASLDMSGVQLQAQQVQLQGQQLQQDYDVASYNLKQRTDIQLYGDIGQDTSRTGYFNFMRSQQAAGYNANSPETSQYFKSGSTFGVENAKFYAGVEHQRTDMVLGRSNLLSDAKFQEDNKYLNQQETFYNEELKVRNEQRQFERDWTKRLLDQHQKSLNQQQKILDQQKVSYELQKERYDLDVQRNAYENASLELQKKFLPEQITNLKGIIDATDQWIQGKGPVNGENVMPKDVLQRLVNVHDDNRLRQLIKETGMGKPEQDALFKTVKGIQSKGGDVQKIIDSQSPSDKGLQDEIAKITKAGGFADQTNLAGIQDAFLKFAGNGDNWKNLQKSFDDAKAQWSSIATSLSTIAPVMKQLGTYLAIAGPVMVALGTLLNTIGFVQAIGSMFGVGGGGGAGIIPTIAGAAGDGLLALGGGSLLGGGIAAGGILAGAAINIGGGIWGWNDYNQNRDLLHTQQTDPWTWAKNAFMPGYTVGQQGHGLWDIITNSGDSRGKIGQEWNDMWSWLHPPAPKGNEYQEGVPGPGGSPGKNSHVTVGANALTNINIDWGKLGSVITKALTGTLDWGKIGKSITDGWQKNVWGPAGQQINEWGDWWQKKVFGPAGQFWNDLPNNWQKNVVGPIGQGWNDAIKNIPNIPGDVVNAFKDGIKGFLNVPKGQSLWDFITNSVKGFFTIPKGKNLWDAIMDHVGNMFGGGGGNNNQGGGSFGGGGGGPSTVVDGITMPHINTPFHAPMWYGELHQGIDLQAAQGTPLREFVGGVVQAAGWKPWGGEVDVKVPGGLTERYLHLSSIGVHPGEMVGRGHMIGATGGGTLASGLGWWSSGSHLHYQLDRGNINAGLDPIPLLRMFNERDIYHMLGDTANTQGNASSGLARGGVGLDLKPGQRPPQTEAEFKAMVRAQQDEQAKAQAHFAEGGIAMQRMKAELAEKEPEAIIPLSKFASILSSVNSLATKQETPSLFSTSQRAPVTLSKIAERLELHVHTSAQTLDESAQDTLMAQILTIINDALNEANRQG